MKPPKLNIEKIIDKVMEEHQDEHDVIVGKIRTMLESMHLLASEGCIDSSVVEQVEFIGIMIRDKQVTVEVGIQLTEEIITKAFKDEK